MLRIPPSCRHNWNVERPKEKIGKRMDLRVPKDSNSHRQYGADRSNRADKLDYVRNVYMSIGMSY